MSTLQSEKMGAVRPRVKTEMVAVVTEAHPIQGGGVRIRFGNGERLYSLYIGADEWASVLSARGIQKVERP